MTQTHILKFLNILISLYDIIIKYIQLKKITHQNKQPNKKLTQHFKFRKKININKFIYLYPFIYKDQTILTEELSTHTTATSSP